MIFKLEQVVKELFFKSGFDVDKVVITKSNKEQSCDYQSNDIFKLAKLYSCSPIEIGQKIMACVDSSLTDIFKNIEFVKPGFLNFTLSDKFINENLETLNEHLGISKPIKEELFILDYGGANVAKPLHVGHMRTLIVGESLKRIIKYMGHKTISDIHLGDYGLQIGQVIYGLKQENLKIDEITIEDLNRIYPKVSGLCKEDEHVKDTCALITKQLQDNNEEYQKYFKKILAVSIADMKKLYEYLNVDFDLWLGESDAYPYLSTVENLLRKKGLLQKSQGALVVEVSKDTDKKEIPPLLFKKSNGAYLYASTDLATIYDRVNKYNPNHILYVVDNRQSLHFEQVFRVSESLGLMDYKNLEFLGYGTVNGKDNKPFKTRSGDAPALASLFEQTKNIFVSKREENENMNNQDLNIVVNAILKFADLVNSREKDYIFDLNKFSDVVGKTGPYILYTYVRLKKILGENSQKYVFNEVIYNEYDRDLRMKLLELSTALNSAFVERKPSYIADYVYNLCVCANAFYQHNHILTCEDDVKKIEWLNLIGLTAMSIKTLLSLLVIDVPSKM